jgi:ABC-type cobalamin transport system permease subunit
LVRANGLGKELVEFVMSLWKSGANMVVKLLVMEEGLLAQRGLKVHQIKNNRVFAVGWELLIGVDSSEVISGGIIHREMVGVSNGSRAERRVRGIR